MATTPERRLRLVVSQAQPPDALDREWESVERAYPHLRHWIVQIKQAIRERARDGVSGRPSPYFDLLLDVPRISSCRRSKEDALVSLSFGFHSYRPDQRRKYSAGCPRTPGMNPVAERER
jgi:hypothetical protein